MNEILCVDVSHHQGRVDWAAVKRAGIEHCILRAGYGLSGADRRFQENAQGAAAAGLHMGAYWFSYASSVPDAQKEADRFLLTLADFRAQIDMPVFFDSEYEAQQKAKAAGIKDFPALYNAMAQAFCQQVQAAGFRPGIYFNEDYYRYVADLTRLAGLPLWLARYKPDNPFACDLWQYTDKGRVDGIDTPVDMNRLLNPALVQPRPFAPYEASAAQDVPLNVRQEPGAGCKLGALRPGQRFTVIEEKNGWGRIEFAPGIFGWVDLSGAQRA